MAKNYLPRSGTLSPDANSISPEPVIVNRIDNPISQSFWGRVPVEMGTSLFRFEKGSAYQALLHELKYRGNRKAGYYLGRLLGNEIVHSTYSVL